MDVSRYTKFQIGQLKSMFSFDKNILHNYVHKKFRFDFHTYWFAPLQIPISVTGGLPFPLIKKQPITVTQDLNTLQTSYFLEFRNSLSKMADIPAAIDHALQVIKCTN